LAEIPAASQIAAHSLAVAGDQAAAISIIPEMKMETPEEE
jgi:hypothetical protein